MIKKLKYYEVDFLKYTNCIKLSEQENGFVSEKMLNAVNGTNWEFLVYDDYKAVMPIPVQRKFGLKLVMKPWGIQQMGVFSEVDNPSLNDHFAEFLLKNYHIRYYSFNENNEFQKFEKDSANFVIPKNEYQKVRASYHMNRRRNVRVLPKYEFLFEEHNEVEKFRNFFYRHIKGEFSIKIKNRFFETLKKLFDEKFLKVYSISMDGMLASTAFIVASEKENYALALVNAPAFLNKNSASIMIDQILQRNIHHKDFSFMGSNIPEIAEFFSRFGSEKRNYLVIENTKKELLKKYFKK